MSLSVCVEMCVHVAFIVIVFFLAGKIVVFVVTLLRFFSSMHPFSETVRVDGWVRSKWTVSYVLDNTCVCIIIIMSHGYACQSELFLF